MEDLNHPEKIRRRTNLTAIKIMTKLIAHKLENLNKRKPLRKLKMNKCRKKSFQRMRNQ